MVRYQILKWSVLIWAHPGRSPGSAPASQAVTGSAAAKSEPDGAGEAGPAAAGAGAARVSRAGSPQLPW